MTQDTVVSPSLHAVEASGSDGAHAEVRWALRMLWLSVAISFGMATYILYYMEFRHWPPKLGLTMMFFSLPLVGCAASAFFNVMIARKRNWARRLQLIFSSAALAYQVWVLPLPTGLVLIKTAAVFGLDFAALFLLYFTPGRHWFRRTPPNAAI